MTVLRQAIDYNPSAPDERAQIVQGTAGYISPDVNKFSTRDGTAAGKDRVLSSILGDIGNLAETRSRTALEDAYLSGAIKASTGEAEETLEGNFITKDWATTGYRDMSGKLAIADLESKLVDDMKGLREQEPEKMQEYLTARKSKLLPTLEGMSREQRAGAFASLVANDKAAMSHYTTEHTKFLIDKRVQTIQAGNAVQQQRLNSALASNDPKQYQDALIASAAFIANNIVLDPSIPAKQRMQITTEVVGQALDSGNVALYTTLRDNKMPGHDKTLLESLPIDDQFKLSQAHRSAVEKHDGIINRDLMTRKALVTAEMTAGTHQGTWEDANARADEWVRAYPADFKGGEAILNQYIEYKNKDHNSEAIALAGATGDFAKAQQLGADESKTINTMRDKMNRDGVQPAQQIAILMSTGLQGGSHMALQEVGKSLGMAVAALDNADGTLNENNSQIIQTVTSKMRELRDTGKGNSELAILSGMPDNTRLRMQRIAGAAETGMGPQQALAWVQGEEKRDASELPSTKAARQQSLGKAVAAYQENIAPTGTVEWVKAHLPFVGKTENQRALSPATSWWKDMTDDSKLMYHYSQVSIGAINEEVQAEMLRPNSGNPEDIVKAAEAKVLARKVDTKYGPMILPQDRNASSYFGINASPAEFSAAMTELLPVQNSKNRIGFEVSQGKISYTEYNKDGNTVVQAKQSLEPSAVRDAVKRIQDRGLQNTNAAVGAGISVPAGTGAVTINGLNTASMDERTMLEVRKSLVKYEGFSEVAKPDVGGAKHKDGSPVMTGGFGVSSTNDFYPKSKGVAVSDLQVKADPSKWGKRPDGTPKGTGFLGVLRRPDGGVSTEVSVGVKLNGTEMDIPTLVPTLTRAEVNSVLSLKEGQRMPEGVITKAVNFAKERLASGKPVFAQPGEQAANGVTTAQWGDAFTRASNQAALEGVKIARAYNLRGEPWKQLTSELTYQSGAETVKTNPAYVALLQSKNVMQAQAILRQTPAWRGSGNPKNPDELTGRQKHYMSLLHKAITGDY